MTTRNPILDTDSYKFSHFKQYPPGTTEVSAYIEARPGADFDAVASMVAVQKLYPQAILVKIGHPDVSVRDFLRLHRSLFPMRSAAEIDLAQVTRIIVVAILDLRQDPKTIQKRFGGLK